MRVTSHFPEITVDIKNQFVVWGWPANLKAESKRLGYLTVLGQSLSHI
jgi:hypothetical protein